jgi:uncharacterized protein YndB with AHSA1/START domain
MLKTVALVLVGLVAAVLVYAATRPDTFRVRRATSIKAPPEEIFPLIDDFRSWRAWSPYERKDPAMRRAFTGAPRGKGAVYEWDGNKEVGQGRLEIVDTAPPSRVTLTLDFVRPFEAHNTVDFTLSPRGDTTEVAWELRGTNRYVSKLIGLFVDMDRMIGGDFETGLASLKAAAERRALGAPAGVVGAGAPGGAAWGSRPPAAG